MQEMLDAAANHILHGGPLLFRELIEAIVIRRAQLQADGLRGSAGTVERWPSGLTFHGAPKISIWNCAGFVPAFRSI